MPSNAGPGARQRAILAKPEWVRGPGRAALGRRLAGTVRPHGHPSVRGDPLGGGLLGIKGSEIVDRPIGPDDLDAPDVAHPHGQQDRGQTFGRFILWRHRQPTNNKTNEIENGAARVAPRRPPHPRVQAPSPERSRVGRDWVATLVGAILLFGDKNLFSQVTDELCCGRRRVQLRRAETERAFGGCFHDRPF